MPFLIQVSKIALEKYELINYKQRWIFEFLIQGPLREFISDDSFFYERFSQGMKINRRVIK